MFRGVFGRMGGSQPSMSLYACVRARAHTHAWLLSSEVPSHPPVSSRGWQKLIPFRGVAELGGSSSIVPQSSLILPDPPTAQLGGGGGGCCDSSVIFSGRSWRGAALRVSCALAVSWGIGRGGSSSGTATHRRRF